MGFFPDRNKKSTGENKFDPNGKLAKLEGDAALMRDKTVELVKPIHQFMKHIINGDVEAGDVELKKADDLIRKLNVNDKIDSGVLLSLVMNMALNLSPETYGEDLDKWK